MMWQYDRFIIEMSLDDIHGALYHIYLGGDERVAVVATLDAAFEWCDENSGKF